MFANCPHCNNNFYVARDRIGQVVECTKCKGKVQIGAGSVGAPLPHNPATDNYVRYNHPNSGVNLREGFKRLALMASLLLGPIIWGVIAARDLYTINASFSEPIDNSLRFLIIWAIGFTGSWIAFLAGALLVRGFAIGRRSRMQKKILKPLLVLAFLSLLPLIPAVVQSARYISENFIWYWEDVFGYFLPWPAAGFASVWGAYLAVLFVGNGFHYRCSDQVLQDMRRFEPGHTSPSSSAAATTWRTT
ncbi:MAG: hypothetical protein JW828_09325 [Sedimentisphaerales bacterium]|nr:hypothetical protein [Sedimentisphaerales bacterium]